VELVVVDAEAVGDVIGAGPKSEISSHPLGIEPAELARVEPEACELKLEEPCVERCVVSREETAVEEVEEVSSYLLEGWSVQDIAGADAMDARRAMRRSIACRRPSIPRRFGEARTRGTSTWMWLETR